MIPLFGYNIVFANPSLLWLGIIIPLLVLIRRLAFKGKPAVYRYSNIPSSILKLKVPRVMRFRWLLDFLFYLALTLIIIALARPQTLDAQEQVNAQGIDIVICLDVSGSMLAMDFDPDRLSVAKEISQQFITERSNDRVGLVIFSGESFTQCPLTLDHSVVIQQLNNVQNGTLRDGTAIGNGLGTAIDRLKDGKGKSKVVILMTDGEESKMGGNTIDPLTALEIAKTLGVKVYTIGVGSMGRATVPMKNENGQTEMRVMDVRIDEPLLKKIANETGGNYYRATHKEALDKIYKEIDKLERVKIDVTSFKNYQDIFYIFLLPAILLLIIMTVMKFTLFRTITD